MSRLFGLFIGVLLLVSIFNVHGDSSVPCYFIFGDSLSDAGNNNNLKTMANANYAPYGIDYLVNGLPTGRFTNGHTIVDVIAEKLSLHDYIAPFYSITEGQISKGVNYASGSAGIFQETGSHLGERVSLGDQLNHHKTIIAKLSPQQLSSCLYTIYIGSNDYINNYFLPEHYESSRKFSPQQFTNNLIDQYYGALKTLHSNGARKLAIFGLGKVGCALGVIYRLKGTACVKSVNDAIDMFNNNLTTLVNNLKGEFSDSKLVYVDVQSIIPIDQKISNTTHPCCPLREDYQCEGSSPPCNDRSNYLFWDGFHPTEAANRAIAPSILNTLASIL